MRRLLSLALLLGLVWAGPACAATKLTVMLDWFVNPDHGPLVIAKEKGFFSDAGLDVDIVAPADPNDPPKLVSAGRADIGITYQPQLHLYADQGLPLVRIGTLIATPLDIIMTLKDGPIHTMADLKGRRVGYSVSGFVDALLSAMLEKNGLKPSDVQLVNVNFALSAALLSGQVDAVVGAYRNFELNQVALEGKPGRAFYPEEEGVPPYDELVFIANRDSIHRPELLAFMDCIERAAQWLVNHPEEGWDVFVKAHKDLDDALNKKAWFDTVPRFALSPRALDHARYQRFAEFLKAKGMIKTVPPLSSYAVDLGAKS
jgi:putative hydroxymethylpyrimidine transport system substrate-binding protein